VLAVLYKKQFDFTSFWQREFLP